MPDHRYIEGGSEELLNLDERTGAEERLWWEVQMKSQGKGGKGARHLLMMLCFPHG